MSGDVPTILDIPPTRSLGPEEIKRKKAKAIGKQSPKMARSEVLAQAEDEGDRGLDIWGTVNVGPRWYSIEGESKETMEAWKAQVDEIADGLEKAVQTGDFSEMAGLMREKFHEADLKKIVQKITAESEKFGLPFDDEAKKLLSIGLWLWREQGGKWAGTRKVIWKVLTTDSAKLSSFLDKNSVASCVDTSYLIKAMAEQYGIEGDVMSVKGAEPVEARAQDRTHRYFLAKSGIVADYWWARGTGGLKLSLEAYKPVRNKMRKPCGS